MSGFKVRPLPAQGRLNLGPVVLRSLYARLPARFGTPIDAVTRREFRLASVAAGTALLLSGSRVLAQRAQPSGKSVIVIGAGFAGLTAAYELLAGGRGGAG